MPQASRMDPHAPHVHPDRRRMHAIFVMLAAVLCFALMDSVLKILSAHYPPFQVATLPGYEQDWMTGAVVYPDVWWRHDAVGLRPEV